MTLKQKFMDLSSVEFPTPVGFVRDDQRCISREVRGDKSHWAVVTDEGEDGFRLVHSDGDGGIVDHTGLTLDEALMLARKSFREAGLDDGLRYCLPMVISASAYDATLGEQDAREFTSCARCLVEGECQQKYGVKPAFRGEDGDCVWLGANAEDIEWEFQPMVVGEAAIGVAIWT